MQNHIKLYILFYNIIYKYQTILKMSLITKMIHFVMETCAKHNIDSSHGLIHSINVLHYAKNIYDDEVKIKPHLFVKIDFCHCYKTPLLPFYWKKYHMTDKQTILLKE